MKRYSLFLLTLLIGLISLPQDATAGRMYDPEISRFMSIDPILNKKAPNELQKLAGGQVYSNSPYNYTFNNPINLVDPDGNLPIIPILWAAVEIGMTAYDAYDVYTTVTNQNATSGEIAASVGGALLGLFMPGGGYSGADDAVKAGVKAADNLGDAIGGIRSGLKSIESKTGNFGIGSSTRAEGLELGQAWVGSNASPILDGSKNIIGYKNADATKTFRLPAVKSNGQAAGKTQMNFQEVTINEKTGKRIEVRNAHLDITD